MEGLDRHTYWILPLHVLAQAGWYKIFGFSLLTLRWLSILCGVLILFAWYSLMSRLSPDHPRIALPAVGLLAVDNHFISIAALGRMDAMCAGLGWAGCAAYLRLRECNLSIAILLGNALVAASCFTHPCGVLYFGALSGLTFYYDRSRLGLREVTAATAPYVAGLSAWGIYILQNPAQFWSQFNGNASGIASEFTEMNRWSGLRSPFGAFSGRFGAISAPSIGTLRQASGSVSRSSFWCCTRSASSRLYAHLPFGASPEIRSSFWRDFCSSS